MLIIQENTEIFSIYFVIYFFKLFFLESPQNELDISLSDKYRSIIDTS
jgi:hypothetical protein